MVKTQVLKKLGGGLYSNNAKSLISGIYPRKSCKNKIFDDEIDENNENKLTKTLSQAADKQGAAATKKDTAENLRKFGQKIVKCVLKCYYLTLEMHISTFKRICKKINFLPCPRPG